LPRPHEIHREALKIILFTEAYMTLTFRNRERGYDTGKSDDFTGGCL
jgi:hypothetical protein